ncbi:hypothetical protein DFJ77DRAFT_95219 [Powellomyces hirtus]|nr:hypothetical protein DFJ77DRAFT_95219 [Powellomyces hirtus]
MGAHVPTQKMVDETTLQRTTLSVLRAGDLDTLTERSVRRSVETLLKLPDKELDAPGPKATVKQLVNAFLENPAAYKEATEDVDPEPKEGQSKGEKVRESTITANRPKDTDLDTDDDKKPAAVGKRKPRAKRSVISDEEDEKGQSGTAEELSNPSPNINPPSPPGSAKRKITVVGEQVSPSPTKAKKRKSSIGATQSPEPNPTHQTTPQNPNDTASDDEQDTTTKSKARARRRIIDSDEDDDDNSENVDAEENPNTTKASAGPKSMRNPSSKATDTVKISEKDEAAIEGLKKYVKLCGVTKRWAKEFEGLSGKARIHHLKQILASLGIRDRPTIEKCKKIKAKREFQAEVQDLDLSNIMSDGPRRARR